MLIPVALLSLTSLVESESCPAPADVEQRVRAILHVSSQQVLDESFIVQRREGGLFVELRSADSATIGERLLPVEGSCDELAQAAAVVLSAWLSDVHPDFAPELPAVEPLAPPVASPRVASPPPQAPEWEAPERVVEGRPASPDVRSRSNALARGWELDIGIGAGVGDGDWAGAGSLSGAFVPKRGLGARVWALVDTTRRESLGAGLVTWRRWPIALGPTFRLDTAALALDITLAPAVSWVRVAGRDFQPAKARSGLTWAGTLDVRLAARGKLAWFVAVNGQAYLGESVAYAAEAEYPLPRFVMTVLVGARFAP